MSIPLVSALMIHNPSLEAEFFICLHYPKDLNTADQRVQYCLMSSSVVCFPPHCPVSWFFNPLATQQTQYYWAQSFKSRPGPDTIPQFTRPPCHRKQNPHKLQIFNYYIAMSKTLTHLFSSLLSGMQCKDRTRKMVSRQQMLFGIKFCEESPNVTQVVSWFSQDSQSLITQSSVQSSEVLSAGAIMIVSSVMLLVSSLSAAVPQSLLDPSFDKFFQNSGSFNQQFKQVQQQQLQHQQINQPHPSQQITKPINTSPPVVR